MLNSFEIIAHKGRNLSAKENSIEGIEEIRQVSQDLRIEIDINVTKDDVPGIGDFTIVINDHQDDGNPMIEP